MIDLSEDDALDVSMVLEDAIESEEREISGIDDDLALKPCSRYLGGCD